MPLSANDEKVVQEAITKLREFFATVQIFVSREEENGDTSFGYAGQGDLFSRISQSELWAQSEKEGYLAGALAEEFRGPDEKAE